MEKKKRLVVPASLAVLTLAGACQPQPTSNPNDPCTKVYGPDCMAAQADDGGIAETPDGGIECIC